MLLLAGMRLSKLSESLTSGIPVLLSSSTRMASIEEFNSLALKKFHSVKSFYQRL